MLLEHTSNSQYKKVNYKTSFHHSPKKHVSTVSSKEATHRLHQIIGLFVRQTRFQKNFERSILNQNKENLKQNLVINVYQFGLRENKSATVAVITFTDIDCKKHVSIKKNKCNFFKSCLSFYFFFS